MRPHRLKTKRRASNPTVWKTLHAAVSQKRKQAASVAASEGMEFQSDVPNLNISRALIVLLILHVVAIGGMYAHSKWFAESEQPVVIEETPKEAPVDPPAQQMTAQEARQAAPSVRVNSMANSGGELHIVASNDTYASIATQYGVDEFELRRVNGSSSLRSGKILRLPAKMVTPQITPTASVVNEPVRVQLQQANIPVEIEPEPVRAVAVSEVSLQTTSTETYIVKPKDTLWKISQKYKMDYKEIMAANNIKDAGKINIGQKLIIPQ